MSSVTVVCPNLRRHVVKVTPSTLLRKAVEEACLKSGYDVNCCIVKNLNKVVDLALPFRLSGLPNNATLEVTIDDKPRSDDVELALQLPDGRRQLLNLKQNATLSDALLNFSTLFNEDLLSSADGLPCCVYMSRKYVGPELEHTTLVSIGISGGKCLLRYQKVQLSQEELSKLVEKAASERQRLTSLNTTYGAAKKENEERDRLEADRLAKFEAELQIKAQEESRKQREAEEKMKAETSNENMEVDPPPAQTLDRLPDIPSNNSGGWSFDSPFSQTSSQPLLEAPAPAARIAHLNSLLERVDRSLFTGAPDNMVNVIAESGRMSLNQLEVATVTMDTESEPPALVFAEPCPRNILRFSRVEQNVLSDAASTEVSDEFFEVGIDDVRKMQKDLKNQVRLQTQRSLLPRSYIEKKNYELKLKAWPHSVIRFVVGDQLIQCNFKTREPISRIFEEASKLFKEKVTFSLSALLNEPLKNCETKNFIEADLAPKSTLNIKMNGVADSVSLLKPDIPTCKQADANYASKEWLSVNSAFNPFTGVVAEEERAAKRLADVRDYPSSASKSSAPSGPKWFKHK